MINFIVDTLHVSASNREVVRVLYRYIKPFPKNERKQVYKMAIKRHLDNKKLYRDCRF
jgi:hypothetical protein